MKIIEEGKLERGRIAAIADWADECEVFKDSDSKDPEITFFVRIVVTDGCSRKKVAYFGTAESFKAWKLSKVN